MIGREAEILGENPSRGYYVHKSHMTLTGIELGMLRWEDGTKDNIKLNLTETGCDVWTYDMTQWRAL
jgi:hypothetical protein